MSSREEETYTYSEVIAGIRRALIEYFDKLAKSMIMEGVEAGETRLTPKHLKPSTGRIDGGRIFGKIGVVDGGSSVIRLNVGYVGIAVSVGIVFEGNRVVSRRVEGPVIIPEDPLELPKYEDSNTIYSVVDKVREALVFENASGILGEGLDLLVVDGPLIPYGAMAKIVLGTRSEVDAWRRYHDAVLKLHDSSTRHDTSVVGFVKRPRSRYLAMIYGWKGFDHIVLSRILSPGEYCPDPPLDLSGNTWMIHEKEIIKLVDALKPKTTYIRMNDSTPPYRVDFGRLIHDYRDILSYLYYTRTREGIPYLVMKADEETKITRKLIRELYEDILHTYIVEYISQDPSMLIPLLPEYGGLV